ncbi:hypothetical protein F3I62_18890 [Pseudomonas sp. R-28-1W-6]|uniref:DUF4116 domain-containing protein n=1 Tax=Pseudomonas sp. R-28-1W-6 TaxID=2650101 RepID=UPI00136588ED|nr:DUF4116 domain-containing protein [Pseudomonas sp. R-28-1W-6]MWV14172.1 hypothetical protein [Pseudomonas sp. R-28-1W-6]
MNEQSPFADSGTFIKDTPESLAGLLINEHRGLLNRLILELDMEECSLPRFSCPASVRVGDKMIEVPHEQRLVNCAKALVNYCNPAVEKEMISAGGFLPELYFRRQCIDVRNNGLQIEFVNEDWIDYSLALEAVKENGLALRHIPHRLHGENLLLAAVRSDGMALEFIPEPSPVVVTAAIQTSGRALKFIDPLLRNSRLCEEALKNSGAALEFVPSDLKTHELVMGAVRMDALAIKYVPEGMLEDAIELLQNLHTGESPAAWVQELPPSMRTETILIQAIKSDLQCVTLVPPELRSEKINDLMIEMVKADVNIFPLIPRHLKTRELIDVAVAINPAAKHFV